VSGEGIGPSPRDAGFWREQAASLRRKGRLAEAAEACHKSLAQDPGDAETWVELAHALRLGGRLDEARKAASRAIELEPRLAAAWFNLGAVHLAQGDAEKAVAANRRALELKPDFAEAWSNLGGALAARGDRRGEIDAYHHALDINPRLAPVWSNLGNALLEAGRGEEAAAACRRAIELDDGFAAAWSNLANALVERGRHEEALQACETALRLAPEQAESWSALGGALHAQRRYDEAIDAQQRAVGLQPGTAQLHFNLGVTFQHWGRSAEAIASLRRALALDPHHAEARYELGLALLSTGELSEGWEGYEWRWRRPGAQPRRYDFAPWNGDLSRPCRLLLWGEQGIGDQIIYGSMIAELLASPLSLTLEVDPRLIPLYRRSYPGLTVIPQRDPSAASAAAYDCQAPLGSLGQWLRRSFESFPRRPAFLVPDSARVDTFRARMRGSQAATVGISWKSANPEVGSIKSTALRDWLAILRVPGIRFIDLQYGDTASERVRVEREDGAHIEHLPDLDLYNDIDGLFALCAACDLVITASNVTAHIAGALGRPVWVIVPKGNGRFWYWFAGRSDSPWYPSMRIVEQVVPGRWRETLDEVARELAAFIERRSSSTRS
jgi:tetratricopeptide (TPR) repeat protein